MNGVCLCGDIAWTIEGPVTTLVNCHCTMCRKSSGATYSTFAICAASDLSWTRGEDRAISYRTSDHGERVRCARCAALVPSIAGEMAIIPAGSLDGDMGRALDAHIFVADKAPWHEITDSAPQFPAYPPQYEQAAVDFPPRQAQTDGAVSGSCLCGKVRYEFDPPAARMLNCHCSRCRRSRSSVHSTQLFLAADQFRWLSGEDNIDRFQLPDAGFAPSFCRDCGSLMPRILDSNRVSIPAGSLDGDPGMRPEAHIFTGSKAAWFEIEDNLPQHAEYPPGR